MSPDPFNNSGLPAYHSDKLLVKMTQAAAAPLDLLSASTEATPATMMAAEKNVGLGMLHNFARAGRIKRAIPISNRIKLLDSDRGPRRALSALASSLNVDAGSEGANSRTSLLEVEDEASMLTLREALASDPTVEYVSRVPIRYLCMPRRATRKPQGRAHGTKTRTSAAAQPPAPAGGAPSNSAMWNLPAISWAQARVAAGFVDADGVKVAVLDTGIDTGHPDGCAILNYVYSHPLLPDASSAKDFIGHGTHVAGTIAAKINNQLGINGITTCGLYIWKIFQDQPTYDSFRDRYVYYVDTAMYHRALAECIDEGIKVVNLSIGGRGLPDQNERDLFDQLIAGGCTVVAAMGNERAQNSPISYPAAIPGVIAVGATRITDEIASFSNRGPHISLCAPGEGIWSTLPTYDGQFEFLARHLPGGGTEVADPVKRETDYDAWNGTSMASPHVAAAAALLLAKDPTLTPAQVRAKLMSTANRVPGMGTLSFHQDFGAGRLNLQRLLA